MYRLTTVLSLSLGMSLACGTKDPDVTFKGNNASQEAIAEQKAAVETMLAEDLVTTNDQGEVIEVTGLTPGPVLDEKKQNTEQELRDMYQEDRNLFDFIPPEGVQTHFSEPVMITGGSLALQSGDGCKALSYQRDELAYQSVLDRAHREQKCGNLSLVFCLRFVPESLQEYDNASSSYVYTWSPRYFIDVPCAAETFDDLDLSIAGDKKDTQNSHEVIEITAVSSVSEVYFTNSPGCTQGGQWQPITSDMEPWKLAFIDNEATVYAKFKDRFGAQSQCLSDSIQQSTEQGMTSQEKTPPAQPSSASCPNPDTDPTAENKRLSVEQAMAESASTNTLPLCTQEGQINCIASSPDLADGLGGLASEIIVAEPANDMPTASPSPSENKDCRLPSN